jgi:hypothetical protein
MPGDCLTIEEYERLPAVLARNHELIDGAVVEESGKSLQHNLLRGLVMVLLARYAKEHKLGIVISSMAMHMARRSASSASRSAHC